MNLPRFNIGDNVRIETGVYEYTQGTVANITTETLTNSMTGAILNKHTYKVMFTDLSGQHQILSYNESELTLVRVIGQQAFKLGESVMVTQEGTFNGLVGEISQTGERVHNITTGDEYWIYGIKFEQTCAESPNTVITLKETELVSVSNPQLTAKHEQVEEIVEMVAKPKNNLLDWLENYA